ncbi:hypothetical protein BDA96_05G143100 [Sorghum bicolor]|uniref:Uncharacterized protein n=1 Tax=Sorghum bicolor TaxID=4558 RepID=A0A921QXB6_SORBI|nr:hypothetical protein BDA96_05G143100 [Sorghum bicolor]
MHTAQCDREFVMRKLGHTGYIECIQENHAFWQALWDLTPACYLICSLRVLEDWMPIEVRSF